MAGPYYVWSSGDNSDGLSWATAKTTLAGAFGLTPAAGETIYLRGGETIGAEIDVTVSGTNAGGWIKLIGTNSSGTVDGTRYVIDANNGSFSCFDFNGNDLLWLENIEVKNTGVGTYYGFYSSAAGATGIVFINCCANDVGSNGFHLNNMALSRLIRCVSYGNTGNGFNCQQLGQYLVFCCSRDNTGHGFFSNSSASIAGCVSHGNTDDGISIGESIGFLMNNVIDGNGDNGIDILGTTYLYAPFILGCRITNHSGSGDIGLNCNSEPVITGLCYFENNDGANIQNTAAHSVIPLEGGSSTSNIEDQSNTNKGYVSETSGSEDFSTGYTDSGDPDLRRTAITIPWS